MPLTLELGGVTYIGIEGPGYEDQIGPSVEITNCTRSARMDG